MKILFVIYIFLATLLGIIDVYNDETDEEGNFKPPWAFILSLIFLAKLCGLV